LTLAEPVSDLIIGINGQYLEAQLPDELSGASSLYPLKNTYLPTKENINIAIYRATPERRLDLTSALAQADPYQCYTDKPNRDIEKIVEGRSISLIGTDLVGCLSTPIPAVSTINQLLSLEFTYHSNTNTPANANITDSSLGGQVSPQPLLAKTSPTFTRIFALPRFVPLQANLILEANEVKTDQEIIYQNI